MAPEFYVKPWKIVVYPLFAVLAIGGIYLLSVWKHRQDQGIFGKKQADAPANMDDFAEVRAFFPTSFSDTLRLVGTTVWMKNGNTIAYFPYVGGQVDFVHRTGMVPPLAQLEIKKVIRAAVPSKVDDGISHGSRQTFVVFALPGSTALYASPIGVTDGHSEAYFDDMLFFYDDPHVIYNYWPKSVWTAIDAHRVEPGMSELETRLAVGMKMHTAGLTEGNRTVTYDENGKTWTVTYDHNKATEIKQG